MPIVNTPEGGAPRKRHAIAAREIPVQPRIPGTVEVDGQAMLPREAVRYLEAKITALREQIRESLAESDGAAADLQDLLKARERELGLIRMNCRKTLGNG